MKSKSKSLSTGVLARRSGVEILWLPLAMVELADARLSGRVLLVLLLLIFIVLLP